MPPRSRNQRDPTGPDTPHRSRRPRLVSPSAIFTQNARSTSRRTGGRPGDRIAGRPVNVTIQPGCRPIATSTLEVLRPPRESAQYTSTEFRDLLAEHKMTQPLSRPRQCWDNAVAESFFASTQTRMRLPPSMAHACARPPRRVRLHRSVLQPAPLALVAGIPNARPIREHDRQARHHARGITRMSGEPGQPQVHRGCGPSPGVIG